MDPRRAKRFVDTIESSIVKVPSLGDTHYLVTRGQYTSMKDSLRFLEHDLRNDDELRELWKTAGKKFRELYKRDPTGEPDDTMIISLIAYSLENPLPMYKTLNKHLRDLGKQDDDKRWNEFRFKGWWLMLHRALVNVKTSPPNILPLKRISLFRGSSLNFQFSTDDCAAFGCLTSTTTSEGVAKQFMGDKGTLLEIDCIPAAALGIKQYSAFPSEEEVLLWPWSSFQVKGVGKEGPMTRVKLSPAGPVVGYNFCS